MKIKLEVLEKLALECRKSGLDEKQFAMEKLKKNQGVDDINFVLGLTALNDSVRNNFDAEIEITDNAIVHNIIDHEKDWKDSRFPFQNFVVKFKNPFTVDGFIISHIEIAKNSFGVGKSNETGNFNSLRMVIYGEENNENLVEISGFIQEDGKIKRLLRTHPELNLNLSSVGYMVAASCNLWLTPQKIQIAEKRRRAEYKNKKNKRNKKRPLVIRVGQPVLIANTNGKNNQIPTRALAAHHVRGHFAKRTVKINRLDKLFTKWEMENREIEDIFPIIDKINGTECREYCVVSMWIPHHTRGTGNASTKKIKLKK